MFAVSIDRLLILVQGRPHSAPLCRSLARSFLSFPALSSLILFVPLRYEDGRWATLRRSAAHAKRIAA
jgi:hypothetical protein